MSSYALIAFAAGIGIPFMAAMNANLGMRLGHPALASIILFTIGGLASLIVFVYSGTPVSKSIFSLAPKVYYFAGLFVAFYILSITWIAPRFGVGNAVFFVLLGQIIAASLIDHFGWLGAKQINITPAKLSGITVMTFGVFLVQWSS
jgi:transporter family-2 protein